MTTTIMRGQISATGPVERRTSAPMTARVLGALVALAAGIVGVAMLVAPGATGDYFSWALGPPVLAATVGAFYVASASVFGWAVAQGTWASLRPLCIAVFGLTLPTLASTVHHRDVFDFDRWQAVAWVVLFVSSAVLFALVLSTTRRTASDDGREVAPWGRGILALLAAIYAVVAVVLWARPDMSSYGPVVASGLGVRFVGSWSAFLAILAGLAAIRPMWTEARVGVFALVLFPLSGLAAAIAHFGELRTGLSAVGYVVGSAWLAGGAASVVRGVRRAA